MVWCSVIQYGMVRYGVVLGIVSYSIVGILCYDVVCIWFLYGLIWCIIVWDGWCMLLVWCGMVYIIV